MTLLILFGLLSVLFSFMCSIWEAVLLSVTPSFVRRKQAEAGSTGDLLAKLKDDIDKPLSAILTLNTIAHTVGAIGVGAQAGKLYGTQSLDLFGFGITYESIVATIMTLAILLASEIIPKTIGANNWQQLAGFTARSVQILMRVLFPFVWLSNALTRFLKKDKERSIFSKQDFAAMAEAVGESGEMSPEDVTLIKNLLEFDDLVARDVMTPKAVMVMAEETQTLDAFYQNNRALVFSRVPIYRGNKDNITGMVLKSELLQLIIEGRGTDALSTARRDITTVLDTTPLRKVFELLNHKMGHMGAVTDEFGAVVGLVTLEDVIETLFGLEIMDETDKVADLQAYARKKWEERAKQRGLIE